jgi:isoquinoline 1-oxidoreductase subunit alpha
MALVQAQTVPAAADNSLVPGQTADGIDLDINGERFTHTGDPQMPLLWYLRDVLQLTGTKYSGEHGEGGADLVLIDGKATSAINLVIAKIDGREITTVEGLGGSDGSLHPMQQAFIDEDAIGCGYCTPGWLMASIDLLRRKKNPSDDDIDTLPNLCRCGCQTRVRRAIKRVAKGGHA